MFTWMRAGSPPYSGDPLISLGRIIVDSDFLHGLHPGQPSRFVLTRTRAVHLYKRARAVVRVSFARVYLHYSRVVDDHCAGEGIQDGSDKLVKVGFAVR